jgi:U3 small nucleolar ribonucleoprotein protein IMP4
LPNALRDVAADLLEEAEFEEDVMNKRDAQGRPLAAPKSRIIPKSLSLQGASSDLIVDSEYATAGYSDPYIMVTTSRDPSSRLTQFAKELKLIFPNSIRINRGNHVLGQLTTACRQQNATDLVLVHETRGIPDGLIISHMPYGPTAYFALLNVVLRHEIDDIGTVSQANPHLILNNFTTKLGERVTHILKHLFPPAKDDSQRVVTFANDNDFISFRHHVYKKSGGKNVEITEAGPRFELQLYQIKLGTVEMTEAENEWVLRPYMNSAKKRHAL